jgi:hypothetical protein
MLHIINSIRKYALAGLISINHFHFVPFHVPFEITLLKRQKEVYEIIIPFSFTLLPLVLKLKVQKEKKSSQFNDN